MRAIPLAVLALAGCGQAYRPGSFTYREGAFTGDRVTVGCLDLAVDRRPDIAKSAVLEYEFGNRCNRDEIVDLAYARVLGRTADGTERTLAPFDPRGQLMALKLGGRYGGREAIAYSSDEPLVQVCVDVASLVQEKPERWLCFARTDQAGEAYAGEPQGEQVPLGSVGHDEPEPPPEPPPAVDPPTEPSGEVKP